MDVESKALSRRLLTAIFAPALLLVIVGVVLGAQVLRMADDASWVEHTERVLDAVNGLQAQIIDQETAIRGFLLTDDRKFLDPYFAARPRELLTDVRGLVEDNASQAERADEIRRRYEAWFGEVAGVPDGKALTEARSHDRMDHRKQLMDALRDELRTFIAVERGFYEKRAATSAASLAMTRSLFIGLFVFASIFLAVFSRRTLQAVVATYATALENERKTRQEMEDEAFVRRGHGELADAVQGELSLEELGTSVLATLAKYTQAEVGAFFTTEGLALKRKAGYALDSRAGGAEIFTRGEGLVGRAAEAEEVLRVAADEDIPKVRAGSGERLPAELLLLPLRQGNKSFGVLELGYPKAASERILRLLDRVGETIAIAVRSAEYRIRLRELLDESQRQAEELQAQQEELRVANEELEEQSKAVREAQARLEERQEELTSANTRLEEQANDLETAREGALEKAQALERANKYKSEFLANMSHELRTPLNSSLILAKLLGDNKDGNLTPEQVKFANTIYGAGNDLLTLINDILDLSKIEAGHLDINAETVPLQRFTQTLERTFEPMAKERQLRFVLAIEPSAPPTIVTDAHRVEQILKNLVSNALKFTDEGEVEVRFSAGSRGLRIAVKDSGIGIAPHQHELVFEAFRQADGASNRKYGGTGLGLSISRDLARLLGGDIVVASEIGKGSTFVLMLPLTPPALKRGPAPLPARPRTTPPRPLAATPPPPRPSAPLPLPLVEDDRASLDARRRVVLVIEDDPRFAQILVDLAHERDFQCIVAGAADEGVVRATELIPSAIILDLNLPDRSGLSVLDRLKRTPATRHIPVHVVSVADHPQRVLSMGAATYLQKPVKREDLLDAFKRLEQRLADGVSRLLVVEDDPVQRESLGKLLGSDTVQIVAVGTVDEALARLEEGNFDCVVTDLALPGKSGFELLEKMSASERAMPPVIVYTGRNLTESEEQSLRKYSSSIIVKGARSPERLLDEVTLFLHQVEDHLPVDRQRMLKQARDRETVLEGRTILVVEDDVRNIFALSSVLEPRGAKVLVARNGLEGLKMLEQHSTIELVLMDIMMPEMDGLTAMREIRRQREWAKLPIIALTAKAMKDDQERCIRAGANDYISKPLDVEMLLSLLRVWLPR